HFRRGRRVRELVARRARPVVVVALGPLPGPALAVGGRGLAPALAAVLRIVHGVVIGGGELRRRVVARGTGASRAEVHGGIVGRGEAAVGRPRLRTGVVTATGLRGRLDGR